MENKLTINSISEEFDKQFPELWGDVGNGIDKELKVEVKQFFKEKLEEILEWLKAEEKTRVLDKKHGRLVGEYEVWKKGYNQAVEELNQKISILLGESK